MQVTLFKKSMATLLSIAICFVVIPFTECTNVYSVTQPLKVTQPQDEFSPYRESTHFIFDVPSNYLKGNITPANLKRWLSGMDKVYEAIADITGWTPENGKKILMIAPKEVGGLMESYMGSNQINWNRAYIVEIMREINDGNGSNLTWGPVHEVAHSFQKSDWSFDIEMCASLEGFFAVAMTNTTAGADFRGGLNGMRNLFYNRALREDNNEAKITCAILDFVKDYGWEAIKKTYRSYHYGSYPYAGQKYSSSRDAIIFHEFIDRIEYFSGVKIRNNYFKAKWLTAFESLYPVKRQSLSKTLRASATASVNWKCNNGAIFSSGRIAMISRDKQSNFSFNINSPDASNNAKLRVYYGSDAMENGGRYASIYVNGIGHYDILFPDTGWSKDYVDVDISIKSGQNTIAVYWSYYSAWAPDFYGVELYY